MVLVVIVMGTAAAAQGRSAGHGTVLSGGHRGKSSHSEHYGFFVAGRTKSCEDQKEREKTMMVEAIFLNPKYWAILANWKSLGSKEIWGGDLIAVLHLSS